MRTFVAALALLVALMALPLTFVFVSDGNVLGVVAPGKGCR